MFQGLTLRMMLNSLFPLNIKIMTYTEEYTINALIFALLFSFFLLAIVIYKFIMASQREKKLITELDETNVKLRDTLNELTEASDSSQGLQPSSKSPGPDSEFSPDKEKDVKYIKKMIHNIGCQLEINKEDNSMSFKYQGEQFFLEYNGVYLRIWDPGWLRVPFEHPAFRDSLKAVNETNFGFGPTVVFTTPDTSGSVTIHSRHDIYYPRFADNDPDFLRHTLNLFFETKQNFGNLLKEINEKGINLPNPSLMNPLIPSDN